MPAMPPAPSEAPTSALHSPAIAPSPTPSDGRPDPVVRWSRILAVGSLLGLIVLGLLWELWLAPTGNGTLAFKVLPLVLPLPGLLKHRMYTYRWVSLLVWIYCAEGLVRATSERGIGAALAAIEVLLCVLLFVACAVQVRWRLKRAAQRRATEAEDGASANVNANASAPAGAAAGLNTCAGAGTGTSITATDRGAG